MESSVGDVNFYEIPVQALKPETRGKLSCMLNRTKVLLSPKKLPRDYRGLGDLMRIEILSNWFPEDNYVQKLLYLWEKEKLEVANLGILHEFFGLIDRYDVLDDTFDMFVNDAKDYKQRKCAVVDLFIPELPVLIKESLTVDDVHRFQNGQQFQIYDAFVLFVDADREFAYKLINRMESDPYNLRLCEKERDLIGGIEIERTAIIKLIKDRCRKLLVILSDEFESSDLHSSFVQFAQSLTFEQQILTKVVPCKYKDCRMPNFLIGYHVLDYRRCNIMNFWNKLYTSIVPRIQQDTNNISYLPSCERLAIGDKPHILPVLPQACPANESVKCDEHPSITSSHTISSTPNGLNKKKFPEENLPTTSSKNIISHKISKFFRGKKKKKRDKAIA